MLCILFYFLLCISCDQKLFVDKYSLDLDVVQDCPTTVYVWRYNYMQFVFQFVNNFLVFIFHWLSEL